MARKPTRFWHPARNWWFDAQEKTRARFKKESPIAKLEDVRPRLQHYLRAMYGESVTIESLAPEKKPGLAVRLLKSMALAKPSGFSESDGTSMRLPSMLPIAPTTVPPLDQYRVLAVQHAERMRRQTAIHAREVTSDLERDLYELAESISIDAEIVESQPGLRRALETARAESLERRARPRWRTDVELRVEKLLKDSWEKAPTDSPESSAGSSNTSDITVESSNNAESNATWARRTAVALESKFGRKATKEYRRMPEVTLWQTSVRVRQPDEQQFAIEREMRETAAEPQASSQNTSSQSMMPGGASSKSTHNRANESMKSSDPTKKSSQQSENADQTDEQSKDQSNERDTGENNSESDGKSKSDNKNKPEVSNDPNSGAEGSGGTATPSLDGKEQQGVRDSGVAVSDAELAGGQVFRYPEWDCHKGTYNTIGTVVRVMPPDHGGATWAKSALIDNAREVHHAKRQFERLRSNRERLRRQLQGEELDLDACVEAMVDLRMRTAPTDRLYAHVRPGRRELAITLVIDVSGSTGDTVHEEQRVIDVERISTLVATAAFDALGDDYSMLAFSSSSASNVRVHTLKEFGEKNSTAVLQRIGALTPKGTTRLGAAVRHATAMLNRHSAPLRLLLVISDGKPYDYDWYWTDYAIQDTRRAIMSARLDGIHPFCITVDTADDETYLPEIFGTSGYRVVNKPSQLSQALLVAVQRMIGSGG